MTDPYVMTDQEDWETYESPGWRCTTDGEAQRLLDTLIREEAEITRIEKLGNDKIARIERQMAELCGPRRNRVERLNGHLIAYRRLIHEQNPKGKAGYRLLGGTLVRRKGGRKSLDITDMAATVQFVREHGNPGLIHTEYKVNKTDLLAVFPDKGDVLMDILTGEIVPGVEVKTGAETWSINLDGPDLEDAS